MNKLLFLIDPAPDAVQTAADLILMLMLHRETALRRLVSLSVQTNPKTQQIEIVAEYAAPPAKTAARRILNFAVPRLRQVRRRRWYAGVSVRKN